MTVAALEREIHARMSAHSLDALLYSMWQYREGYKGFQQAGFCAFAVRFSRRPRGRNANIDLIDASEFASMMHLCTNLLLADPVTSGDQDVPSEMHSILLRNIASQVQFDHDYTGHHVRALILFQDIPNELVRSGSAPTFNFQDCFLEHYGCSPSEFATVACVAYFASRANGILTRGYFEKARQEGIDVPTDATVIAALRNIATTPSAFRAKYIDYKQTDRRFAAYDFNPLLVWPIIRPWEEWIVGAPDEDRMLAPIPNLLLWRMCVGVYYDMRNRYREDFTQYFGKVFEQYVGRVLKACVPEGSLLSEAEIRRDFPTSAGRAPDWAVVDGTSAIFLECKATHFSRRALVTGADDAIESSARAIKDGLGQLGEFTRACAAGQVNIESLSQCSRFVGLVVTFESMTELNAAPLRSSLHDFWLDAEPPELWGVTSLDLLEMLQPFFGRGLPLAATLTRLLHEHPSYVIEDANCQFPGITFKDSFLHSREEELYDKLVPSWRDGNGAEQGG